MHSNVSIGKKGEEIATKFLIEKGWSILTRNYSCYGLGEIDIVALDPLNNLVFVEVKSGTSQTIGVNSDRMNPHKISKIKRCAYAFLSELKIKVNSTRVDYVGVIFGQKTYIEHFEITW